MKARTVILSLFLGVCAPLSAQAEQCVPFARDISGVALSGDAWRWWAAAEGRYDRGVAPRVGAVLVFKATGKMRKGHVSVVRSVVSSREIRVDHANWPRNGGIFLDQLVVDVSAANNWSQVKVSSGGRVNPVHGFIYPSQRRPAPERILEAAVRPALPAAARVTLPPSTSAVNLNAAVLAKLRGVSPEHVLKGLSKDKQAAVVQGRTKLG